MHNLCLQNICKTNKKFKLLHTAEILATNFNFGKKYI